MFILSKVNVIYEYYRTRYSCMSFNDKTKEMPAWRLQFKY